MWMLCISLNTTFLSTEYGRSTFLMCKHILMDSFFRTFPLPIEEPPKWNRMQWTSSRHSCLMVIINWVNNVIINFAKRHNFQKVMFAGGEEVRALPKLSTNWYSVEYGNHRTKFKVWMTKLLYRWCDPINIFFIFPLGACRLAGCSRLSFWMNENGIRDCGWELQLVILAQYSHDLGTNKIIWVS